MTKKKRAPILPDESEEQGPSIEEAYEDLKREYAAYRKDRQQQMTRIREALDEAAEGTRTGNMLSAPWVVASIEKARAAWRGEDTVPDDEDER